MITQPLVNVQTRHTGTLSAREKRPEVILLLCCAHTQVSEAMATLIQQTLQQDIHWATVINLADRHGLLPLLHQSLHTGWPTSVPPLVLAQLRQAFHRITLHNLFLTQELLKLLAFLRTHNVPVIPYKGPILAASVYGSLAARQFGDLDIWVQATDRDRVKALLISEGFTITQDLGWELDLFNAETGIHVDLHQALMPKHFAFALHFDQVQSRLQSIALAGTSVPTFSPEDLLLLLCVQFGKDCCHWRVRLIQLCDVAELLRTYPALNWGLVWEQACQLGCERIFLLTLALTRDLLGIVVPDTILDRLQTDVMVRILANEVYAHFWEEANASELTEEPTFWSFLWVYNHRFYLAMRERTVDKVTYCMHWLQYCFEAALTLNEKDIQLLQLPQGLYFMYYPLRLIRLIRARGGNLLKSLHQ